MTARDGERSPNGSVDALATAFRDVIVEAVEPIALDVQAIRRDVSALESLIGETADVLEERLGERIDTVAANTSAQFAVIEERLPPAS